MLLVLSSRFAGDKIVINEHSKFRQFGRRDQAIISTEHRGVQQVVHDCLEGELVHWSRQREDSKGMTLKKQ